MNKIVKILTISVIFIFCVGIAFGQTTTYIKDKHQKLIGILEETSDKITLRDNHRYLIGVYYKNQHKTRDRNHKLIGDGNQLLLLLN
jgi:hypothetical protein